MLHCPVPASNSSARVGVPQPSVAAAVAVADVPGLFPASVPVPVPAPVPAPVPVLVPGVRTTTTTAAPVATARLTICSSRSISMVMPSAPGASVVALAQIGCVGDDQPAAVRLPGEHHVRRCDTGGGDTRRSGR